jgi:hypothetical protein
MGENREAITALLAIRQRAGISPRSDWKVFRFDYCCFTSAFLLLSYWFAPAATGRCFDSIYTEP